MRRTSMPVALVLAGLLGLLIAAPASAAIDGTFCGQITAFTAPTAVTDGSITIDGETEIIDSSAFGVVDITTFTTLMAVANADATTCVVIDADGDGNIIDIEIAAQAEICGTAALDTVSGLYSVAGVDLLTTLVDADADLAAFLDVAATVDADVCVDVTIDGTTGLITTISLNATLSVCGDATLDADSVVLAGLDVPLSLLDAEARAALELAIDVGADVCLTVVVDATNLVEANLSADIDLCGEVALDADGNVTVDGVVIDDVLLNADAAALLALAAEADGTACVAVDAASNGGDTSVGVSVVIEVCAEVTAVTEDTVTIGDVTFIFVGAADAGIEVGDEVCVTASQTPTGDPVIIDSDTTDDDDTGTAPGAGDGTGAPTLPDTATGSPLSPVVLGTILVVAAAIAASATRRGEVSLR